MLFSNDIFFYKEQEVATQVLLKTLQKYFHTADEYKFLIGPVEPTEETWLEASKMFQFDEEELEKRMREYEMSNASREELNLSDSRLQEILDRTGWACSSLHYLNIDCEMIE